MVHQNTLPCLRGRVFLHAEESRLSQSINTSLEHCPLFVAFSSSMEQPAKL